MAEQDIQSLMRAGVQAARAGNKKKARRIFERVLEIQDDNELGWMWMASVVESVEERRVCLENVLDINPRSARARKALEQLKAPEAEPSPPPPPPKTPSPPRQETSAWSEDRWTEKFDTGPAAAPAPSPKASERPRSGRRNRTLFILGLGFLGIAAVVVIAAVLILKMEGSTPPPADITAAAPPAAAPTRVVVVNPEDREVTQVPTWTQLPTSSPPAAPTFTPTPLPLNLYQIAYARQTGGENVDIHMSNGDGSKDTPIIQHDAPDTDPAVSPDGQEVVFVSDRGEAGPELYIINPDRGGAPIQLTDTDTVEITAPAWSPDGERILFSAVFSEGADSEIYTLLRDDPLKIEAVTENQAMDRDPAWSPDGKTILFASDRITRGLFQIFAVPADCFDTSPENCEENIRQLTQSQNSNTSPAWSPEGEQIVFVSNRVSIDDPDIYVMRADGTDAQPLTLDQYGDDDAVDAEPAWSPDGRWIAFVSSRDGGRFDIYLMSVDGAEVHPITETGSVSSPSWFPLIE